MQLPEPRDVFSTDAEKPPIATPSLLISRRMLDAERLEARLIGIAR
jgi:hypothetical protein